MKKLLLSLLLMLALQSAAYAGTDLYVDGGNADRVHLRSGPSMDAKSLGLVYSGTAVRWVDEQGDWSQVELAGESCWIKSEYLAEMPTEMKGPMATVINPNDTWVNLREATSTKSRAVAQVPTYDRVYILGEMADGWHYISWRSQDGFMMSRFLEIQEEQAAITPEVVGVTPDGSYIQRIIADNGQQLYFTSVEEQPPVKYEDVNFDGVPDIVAFTALGASNFYSVFFVRDGETYVYARNTGTDYGLVNYSLFPEYGIVMSQSNNGSAGALRETCLFRWEGTELKLLRRLVSEELSETAFAVDSYTTTVYLEKLHVTIRDYRAGGYEGTVIYDEVFADDEWQSADWYAQINDFLWQGVESVAYIQQYVVNTGKELELVSIREGKMEGEVLVSLAEMGASHDVALDVNFDGLADRVHLALTDTGKVTAAFDVYADGQYIPVTYPGPLTAFQLYPRYGLVRSNGGTPEKRDTCMFRWDGTELALIRRMTQVIEGDSFRAEVWDCQYDSEALLYGKTMTLEESRTDAAHNEIDDALWQGIR